MGANSAPPDPLAGFKGPTSKGRGGKGGMEGGEGSPLLVSADPRPWDAVCIQATAQDCWSSYTQGGALWEVLDDNIQLTGLFVIAWLCPGSDRAGCKLPAGPLVSARRTLFTLQHRQHRFVCFLVWPRPLFHCQHYYILPRRVADKDEEGKWKRYFRISFLGADSSLLLARGRNLRIVVTVWYFSWLLQVWLST